MIVVEGRAYLDGRLEKCCVGIENGRIAAIKKVLKGDKHYDCGDMLVLPGCIDIHVHFREPGRTDKEDFRTGTMAAAFGGVTCALDMPNNVPPINSLERLKGKLELVRGRANIDFGLYTALTNSAGIEAVSELTTGFKVYMAETTDSAGIGTGRADLEPLVSAVPVKKVVSVHCEDERFLNRMEEKSLEDHLNARPVRCELEALKHVLGIAKSTGRSVHIAHVTSAEGVEVIRRHKRECPVTSEVTASHMLLNVDCGLKAFGKVNPPLRRREDNEALRRAFSNGVIDVLASDHAPHTIEEKSEGFAVAPSGMPGVETTVPIVLRLLKKDFVSLERFVHAACSIPAQMFDLNKGAIRPGYDGDLIVVDLKDVRRVRGDGLHSKCAWTPFEDHEAVFPKSVFLRGTLVVEDGNLVEERAGRFVGSVDG